MGQSLLQERMFWPRDLPASPRWDRKGLLFHKGEYWRLVNWVWGSEMGKEVWLESRSVNVLSWKPAYFWKRSVKERLLPWLRLRMIQNSGSWGMVENLDQCSGDKHLVMTNWWSQINSAVHLWDNKWEFVSLSGLTIGKKRGYSWILSKSYGELCLFTESHVQEHKKVGEFHYPSCFLESHG